MAILSTNHFLFDNTRGVLTPDKCSNSLSKQKIIKYQQKSFWKIFFQNDFFISLIARYLKNISENILFLSTNINM
jgi:hypothetical protein